MLDAERSPGTLALALAALLLVGAAFALPWLSYDYSSGRQIAEGGFHDPAETGLVRHDIDFFVSHRSGDVEPTDAGLADDATLWLTVSWAVCAAGFLLMALAEVPVIGRWVNRGLSLTACLVALLGLAAALAIAWFWLPDSLSGFGIHGPEDYHKLENGYVRSSLGFGWVAAAFAIPFALGAFAFKFQAGSTDPDIVEAIGRRHRQEAP